MLDIRMPIGLLFTIFGILLTVFGLIYGNDPDMLKKALDVNINLYMGIIMLVFGGIMLYFALAKKAKIKE